MRNKSSRSTGRTRVATTTCEPLAPTTSSPSTSSAGASRAKTSLPLAEALASVVSAAVCGSSTSGSLASYDPASSSWRTSQFSLFGGQTLYSGDWPRSGMVRSGRLYALPTLALRTSESGSSAWPTPRASQNENRQTVPSPSQLAGTHGWNLAASVNCLWPTPTVCGNHNRKGASPTSGDGLATAPRSPWGTPRAGMERSAACSYDRGRGNLEEQVGAAAMGLAPTTSRWPTPTARDWKSGSASQATLDRNARPLSEIVRVEAPGPLNPDWVTALMGFPPGWLDIDGPPLVAKPSTTGSRRARRTASRTDP